MQQGIALHRPTPLAQQVYDALREMLRSGRFAPAERITELGLARELNVSRTPVREALGQLCREGFVVVLPRGGYAVPAVEEQDIDEMFEVRGLLEPYAAAQAARGATPAGLVALEQAMSEERAARDDPDAGAFMAANRRFRVTLFELAGNTRLARMIETFEDHAQYVRWVTLEDKEVRDIVIMGQERLMSAMRKGDAEAAEQAMRAQLTAARRALMNALGKCRPADVTRRRGNEDDGA